MSHSFNAETYAAAKKEIWKIKERRKGKEKRRKEIQKQNGKQNGKQTNRNSLTKTIIIDSQLYSCKERLTQNK